MVDGAAYLTNVIGKSHPWESGLLQTVIAEFGKRSIFLLIHSLKRRFPAYS
jgi:hypothetical protein